jgi:hypothetical protein
MLVYPIDNPKMNIMALCSQVIDIDTLVSVRLNDIKYNKSSILCLGELT